MPDQLNLPFSISLRPHEVLIRGEVRHKMTVFRELRDRAIERANDLALSMLDNWMQGDHPDYLLHRAEEALCKLQKKGTRRKHASSHTPPLEKGDTGGFDPYPFNHSSTCNHKNHSSDFPFPLPLVEGQGGKKQINTRRKHHVKKHSTNQTRQRGEAAQRR